MFTHIARHVRYFDWISCGLTFTLACIGIIFVWSTTHTAEVPLSPFFKKQCLGILIGSACYLVVAFLESHTLLRWGALCYLALIPLLTYTLIKGSIGMGAQRWINLVIFQVSTFRARQALFSCLRRPSHVCYTNTRTTNFRSPAPACLPRRYNTARL